MIDRLIEGIIRTGNPTVLGLDTRIEYLPGKGADITDFTQAAQAIETFNRELIDAAVEIIPAVKVQVAYYEMYGVPGMQAFENTLRYAAEKGLITIADCKRNDIGATASAYSAAHLGRTPLGVGEQATAFNADYLTVTPYLGVDGIEPFVKDCKQYDKGIFVLVKTSNPSSGQLQDQKLEDGRTVYEMMGDLVEEWGASLVGSHGYSAVGAVVGATYPAQGTALRQRLKNTFFLIPGYGAQGATGLDLVGCFDSRGLGGIVNASRSLLCAHQKEEHAKRGLSPADAMYEEATKMREDIVGNLIAMGQWEL